MPYHARPLGAAPGKAGGSCGGPSLLCGCHGKEAARQGRHLQASLGLESLISEGSGSRGWSLVVQNQALGRIRTEEILTWCARVR